MDRTDGQNEGNYRQKNERNESSDVVFAEQLNKSLAQI